MSKLDALNLRRMFLLIDNILDRLDKIEEQIQIWNTPPKAEAVVVYAPASDPKYLIIPNPISDSHPESDSDSENDYLGILKDILA